MEKQKFVNETKSKVRVSTRGAASISLFVLREEIDTNCLFVESRLNGL